MRHFDGESIPDVARAGELVGGPAVPLIAEHDTWITVDPILGCPADCSYCYLGTLGLRRRRPVERTDPERLAKLLISYLRGRRSMIVDPDLDRTPICIGNYTDMVISVRNQRRLIAYLAAIARTTLRPRPIVVITKGRVTPWLVSSIDAIGWPVYWFLSQSMAGARGVSLEFGPIADLSTTLLNAETIANSVNQQAIHFWRPFVPELRQSSEDLPALIDKLKSACFGCSVVVGLKRGPGVPLHDSRLLAAVGKSAQDADSHSEAFDTAGWTEVRRVAREYRYPVYRNSSCAVALTGRHPEQLGTARHDVAPGFCFPCYCPAQQRSRCSRPGDHQLIDTGKVAEFLQIEASMVRINTKDRSLDIATSVSEHQYNVLAHGLGSRLRISPTRIVREKAWLGGFAERFGQ